MTTTLLTLRSKLQKTIGDDKLAYADKYTDALNYAAEDLYPIIFKPIDDETSLDATLDTYEYELPTDFNEGHLSKVFIQPSGSSTWTPLFGWQVIVKSSEKYLKLDKVVVGDLRLEGYTKFEALTTDVSTISLDGEKLSLLIAQAIIRLYEMKRGVISMDSRGRYDEEISYWRYKAEELKGRHRMSRPASQIRWVS